MFKPDNSLTGKTWKSGGKISSIDVGNCKMISSRTLHLFLIRYLKNIPLHAYYITQPFNSSVGYLFSCRSVKNIPFQMLIILLSSLTLVLVIPIPVEFSYLTTKLLFYPILLHPMTKGPLSLERLSSNYYLRIQATLNQRSLQKFQETLFFHN